MNGNQLVGRKYPLKNQKKSTLIYKMILIKVYIACKWVKMMMNNHCYGLDLPVQIFSSAADMVKVNITSHRLLNKNF